jgi:hypothetical protein
VVIEHRFTTYHADKSTQVDLVANTTKKSHWQGFAKGKQWDAALRVALHITNPE